MTTRNSKIRSCFRDLYKMDKYRTTTDEEKEKVRKKNEKRIKKNKKLLEVKTHVLLRHDEPLPLVDISKKRFKDSPYEFSFEERRYDIPTKMIREEISEYMLKNKISTSRVDFLFWDVQFHSKEIRTIKEVYHDRTQPNIQRLWQIFNNSFYGLTWIYPLKMKIVFDSLYHLNALLREIALYWAYPNMDKRKTTGKRKYTDFIIDQKTAELCSERFNQFLETFHHHFLIEYMYRHYQRWERYPLRYEFIFDLLIRFLIIFVFDRDEALFRQFMRDDKHGIPIKYIIDDVSISMRVPTYKVKTDYQYRKINTDLMCNEKQKEFDQLMINFKRFLREHCLPHYENNVVMKTRNATVSGLKTYDLCRDDPEHDTLNDVSIVYGKSEDWLNKYKFMIPVTSEWLHQVKTKKIVNHGHIEIIFWNRKHLLR